MRYSFGLDLRSLAATRMLLGMLQLVDLAIRATDLASHYTDEGVLPRRTLLDGFADPWHFSLHLLSGKAVFQAALFLISALSAVCLALGYRTRTASLICWLLTVSLQNRNPLLLSGADVLFRLVLFWMMFLPLGTRWSLDRLRGVAGESAANLFVSVGTAAYTLQIVSVYVFAGLIKLDIRAWTEGAGLAYALRAAPFETALGMKLLDYPELLRAAGVATPYFEIAAPLLLLVPTRAAAPRLSCVAAFVAFHIGIGLAIDIGIFSLVCIVAWSAFLPPYTWDHVVPAVVQRFGVLERIAARLRALAQRAAEHSLTDQSCPSVASVRLMRARRRLTAALCVAVAAYVLALNVVQQRGPATELPSSVRFIAPMLRVDQHWNMFSAPITKAGWLVAPGRLRSGRKWELIADSPEVSWDRPKIVGQTFPNDRWRKYMVNLTVPSYHWARVQFGNWKCSSWNREHGPSEQLEAFSLYLMEEPLTPWAAPVTLVQVPLLQHECKPGMLKKWARKI
jgi:hypothetical protein